MRPPSALALLSFISSSLCSSANPASSAQQQLTTTQQQQPEPLFKAQLKGRFLHLTDLHPDPLYTFNSSEALACHVHNKKELELWQAQGLLDDEPGLSAKSGKNKGEDERAGYWGTPVSECDAPLTLINATLDWISTHFADQVDFVIWTGDSARHDIDLSFPRSMPEIFRLNRMLSGRMRDIFGKHIPIIPSFGNNDIYPHNIMFGGPSQVTSEFLDIWRHFIPESQLHSFARGGYFTVDALPQTDPGALSVVSLNTLYFFENNKAVDGCPAAPEFTSYEDYATSSAYHSTERLDPGTEHILWLEQQLLLAREAGTKVWLSGHVPASKNNWYEGCYTAYVELGLRFHDTILGHVFGHVNSDHFSFLRKADLDGVYDQKITALTKMNAGGVRANAKSTSQQALNVKDDFNSLPKGRKTFLGDFAIVNANPSVIPTFLPAVRVYSFNISSSALAFEDVGADAGDDVDLDQEEDNLTEPTLEYRIDRVLARLQSAYSTSLDEFKKRKKKKSKKPKLPKAPARHYDPRAPSVTNTFLSALGFTQYWLPLELVNLNAGYGLNPERTSGPRPSPEFIVEYTTWGKKALVRGLEGGWGQPGPIPKSLWPPELEDAFVAEKKGEKGVAVEVVKALGWTPYGMKDLTVGSWLKLARALVKTKKAWQSFETKMFVSSGATD